MPPTDLDIASGITVPVASAVVAAAIALLIMSIQVFTANRQRRADLIRVVLERMAEVVAESNKAADGEGHDVRRAVEMLGASLSALRFALPWWQRIVPKYISYEATGAWLENQLTLGALSEETSRIRVIFEGWVLHHVRTRQIRQLAEYKGGMGYGASITTEWKRYQEEVLAVDARAAVPATAIDDMKRTRSWKKLEKRTAYKKRLPERWVESKRWVRRKSD